MTDLKFLKFNNIYFNDNDDGENRTLTLEFDYEDKHYRGRNVAPFKSDVNEFDRYLKILPDQRIECKLSANNKHLGPTPEGLESYVQAYNTSYIVTPGSTAHNFFIETLNSISIDENNSTLVQSGEPNVTYEIF